MVSKFPLLIILCLVQAAIVWSDCDKPNIIMFVLDDLGWNDTGYQGADYSTPTIDSMAAEAIRLKQYYTQPLCSPSRTALLSGKYPYNLGLADTLIINGVPLGLNLEDITFTQGLKDGGYSTHAVGKWNVGMHKWDYTPTYRGFDTFYGYYGSTEDYLSHSSMTEYNESLVFQGLDLRHNEEPVTNQHGVYSTYIFTEAIQDAIKSQNRDNKPFFVYGAYQTPHTPLEVPDHYLEMCSDITYENRQFFCGMMKAVDEGIMNITDMLESEGLLDNTVIIFTTDNGGDPKEGSCNWPLRGCKGTLFEGGIRGVAFVWGKMLPKTNYDYDGLMHITDWYRTIVEGIAGIELGANLTESLDGFNMWQALTENTPSPRNELLLQLDPPRVEATSYFMGQAAFRSGYWKLITGDPNPHNNSIGWVQLDGFIEGCPYNPTHVWLFNMTADPNERHNLSQSFPEVVSQLKERIEVYNSSHIYQLSPSVDIRSNPANFDGVWTPWLK